MRYLPLILAPVLLLAACSSHDASTDHPTGDGKHMENHKPGVMKGLEPLVLEDKSTDQELAFSITNDGKAFADYGIAHTKQMHLIAVRRDLTDFHHLHPILGKDNVWRAPFTASGGTYWLYADFVDSLDHPYIIRFMREYPGEQAPDIVRNPATVKTVGGYTVTFSTMTSASGVDFRYDITDAKGKPVVLEQYLGARGHSILISPSGEYEHTHDISGEYIRGGNPDDPLDVLLPIGPILLPYYRIFTQFQVNGKVYTVNFDWDSAK